jgi:hypothetical protein
MGLQGMYHVELWTIDDLFDFIQAEIQFLEEQDLLEPEHGFLAVIAVAIFPIRKRLEQPDLIVKMQGADADACQV